MKSKSQAKQSELLYPSPINHVNTIKLTQFGFETIDDMKLDSKKQSQFDGNKTMSFGITNSSEIKHIKSGSNFQKTEEPNRKLMRAHEAWKKNRQQINKNMEKQLIKRDFEKSQPYEWKKISCPLKKDIENILTKWDTETKDEKQRVQQRVKNIHNRKLEKQKQNVRKTEPIKNRRNNQFF